ncbi:hypothetical protein [Aurantimonas coralicida]|uniref:hypothetical protein n=1 Tax=Aurantimonas coralicida TaxID=182270 RepID=UPI001D193C9B|nr:hypothetical protein [Aurantimonas coralicida]MCC4300206.1 hypothetical protein [Aurantimonas coralicida]
MKQLDQDSAIAFPYEVERTERKYPIVVLSANSEGEFPVDVERIRSVVAGLASIVQIPASVDTFQLQEQVGRRYMAFGGAINIIFPATHVGNAPNYRSTLILPDKIAEIIEDGQSIETEILSAITHRMNLPNSWQHVSLEVVNQAALRQQMHALIQRDSGTTELNEYVELLEAADAELNSKDNSIAQLQQDLEARDLEAEKLQAEIDGLKHSLSGINAKLPAHPNIDGIADLRDAVDQLLGGRPKLAQTLRLFDAMYQDRVRILATAYDAAQASDQAGFVHGKKAFELLSKLAGPYWSALANGQGDQQAKSVFGNSFASREADTLSSAGRKRRTFSYGNELVFMEKHLKHGVKDSAAETLRIHFEWIAAEKLVVIGHCGKHLDF